MTRQDWNVDASVVPVEADPDRGDVDLVSVSEIDMRATFLDVEWARVRGRAKPTRVPIASLEPGPGPAGFVFHTGRCGSSLFQRMLGHCGATVVGEPAALRTPHLSFRIGELEPEVFDHHLERLGAAFARAADGQPTIIRVSSWQTADAAHLLDLFPAARAVFLYRDPHEVVASNVVGPPVYMERLGVDLADEPARAEAWFPGLTTVAGVPTAADVHALEWAMSVEGALDVDRDRLLVIDYQTLQQAPKQVLADAAAWFGLTVGDETAALAERGSYTKSFTADAVAYEPNATHRRPPLRSSTRTRVNSLVEVASTRLVVETGAQAPWLDA